MPCRSVKYVLIAKVIALYLFKLESLSTIFEHQITDLSSLMIVYDATSSKYTQISACQNT